jgi:hypothetical protein
MTFRIICLKIILINMLAFNTSFSALFATTEPQAEEEEEWSCSGWCLLGADTPTNPWIPVSSTGATEQEARDNIDCGIYEEVAISCRHVQ